MTISDDDGPQEQPTPDGKISNPLGIAGFVVSLIGLCSGGMLSVVGLVLSIVAVFRRPRGFAIAGIILGVLGVMWIAAIMLIVGASVLMAVVLGLVEGRGALETAVDSWQIKDAIIQYEEDNGALPTDLSEVSGIEAERLEDRWGRPYHVTIDTKNRQLEVVSDGPDGQAGTDDDVEMSFDF
jgi:Type II secretion system (T2SS), protein G